MNLDQKDILLDEGQDLLIVNGDFVIGQSLDQEVQIILQMTKGELREDPLMGADLFRLINANIEPTELKIRIKNQLARDRKNYDAIKERISLKTNE